MIESALRRKNNFRIRVWLVADKVIMDQTNYSQSGQPRRYRRIDLMANTEKNTVLNSKE